jgi:predicted nucleotidyltransferase
MKNRTINIGVVEEVAQALKELKDQMVFVGGAVISLYADDPAAEEIRPTKDIDMTVRLMQYNNWEKLEKQLTLLGFHPDPFGHAMCSYKYKDIPVDIMLAEDSPFGSANKWYKLGFNDLHTAKAKEEDIQILSPPCYLATKFEAFNGRGIDYRTSHDFEDIIYVMDNRTTIVEEIANTLPEIKSFLQSELQKVIENQYFEEIISVHIHPLVSDERQAIVEEKIRNIIAS